MVPLQSASAANGSSTVDLGSHPGPPGNADSPSAQASWDRVAHKSGLHELNHVDDMGWGNGRGGGLNAASAPGPVIAVSDQVRPRTLGDELGLPGLDYTLDDGPAPPATPPPAPPTNQSAAPASPAPAQPESHWYTRPLGLVQAAGGAGEVFVGGVLLGVPEPTGLTKVGGYVVGAHGIDDVQAGLRTAWTGRPTETVTQHVVTSGAQALGANPGTAAVIGAVVDGGLGMANPEGEAGKVVRGAVELGEADRAAQAGTKAAHEAAGITDAEKAAKASPGVGHIAAADSSGQAALVRELVSKGVKVTPSDVVGAASDVVGAERTSSGQIAFLERGNSASGLQHIVERHGAEFAQAGIPESKIPDFLMNALKQGKVVGQQGRGAGRPIYEVNYEGRTMRVAITIGSNGHVVGPTFNDVVGK